MFKNQSLNTRILFGFIVVCVGLAIIALTSYVGLQKVVSTYNQLAEVSVPNLGHISGMRSRGRQIHAEVIKLALYWDQEEEIKKTLESLQHALKRYDAITEEYLAAPFSPGEKEIYQDIEKKYAPIKSLIEQILSLQSSTDSDRIPKIKNILLKFEEHVREHQSALLKLDDYHVELGTKWSHDSEKISRNMNVILVTISLLTFVLGISIALLLSKSINTLLRNLANRLVQSSEKVASDSLSVKNASEDLSKGTTEQAEALHETVTSTNEIAVMTEKTSLNSRESLKRAELSRESSSKGQKALDQMLNAITDISHSTQAINTQIKRGNEEIQEIVNLILNIGEKTKLIDDIVFQTKLLSFNVSVEAARAGEHGKGFAVVAEEMTNLANLSGRASKEITEMLSTTTEKALKIVDSNKTNIEKLLSTGNEKIQAGHYISKECKVALEEILTYVEEMCSMIHETTVSTSEQSKGVNEINRAMALLDSRTAQNAQASQLCANASQSLMIEVEHTRNIVHDLFETIHGKGNSKELKTE